MRRALLAALGPSAGSAWSVASSVTAHAPRALVAARLYLAPRLRVLCWPGRPGPFQALTRICAMNGYAIVHDPDAPYDVAVHFAEGGACALPADRPVINRGCTDISKAHVAAVFEAVFGYPLSVDPTRHRGRMLSKSNANNTHDGEICEGPLDPSAVKPGRVYQRFISSEQGGNVRDWRTPIYGGQVPLVYCKRRPLGEGRFLVTVEAQVFAPEQVYSRQELERLTRFAAAMRLDYGELDVMRDNADGRIYVVDVANTPAGPPDALPLAERRRALRTLAAAFEALTEAMRRRAS